MLFSVGMYFSNLYSRKVLPSLWKRAAHARQHLYNRKKKSNIKYVCFMSSIFTADWVEHILPQAHLRLPGVSPSQLVPYPPHRSHHGTHCAVCSELVLWCSTVPHFFVMLAIFVSSISAFVIFLYSLSDNIMHTWQTLSVNGLEHNAGCLGKYVCFVL